MPSQIRKFTYPPTINTLSPETPTERRDRQLANFRHAADKAMRSIDIASEQLEIAHASGQPGATASPTLDLARSIRALVAATNGENRVVAGIAAPRAPANNTRRPLLRDALHKAADAEPNPKLRAALHRDLDARIEETLLEDLDGDVDLTEHLCALADEFDLQLDVTKLPDALLGIVHVKIPQPGADPATHPGSSDTGDPSRHR